MNFKNQIVLLITVVYLLKCSAPPTFVNQHYKNKKINDAVLYVPKIEDEIIVRGEEVFNEIGITYSKGNYTKMIIDKLSSDIIFYSTFKKVDYIDQSMISDTVGIKLKLNENQRLCMSIPENPIKSNEKDPVFILIFDNLLLCFHKENYEEANPSKKYFASSHSGEETVFIPLKNSIYSISLEANFLVYDNTASSIVSYGHFVTEESFNRNRSIDQIISLTVKGLVRAILYKSPFEH